METKTNHVKKPATQNRVTLVLVQLGMSEMAQVSPQLPISILILARKKNRQLIVCKLSGNGILHPGCYPAIPARQSDTL